MYGLEFLLSYGGTEATQKGRFDSEFTYFSSNFLYHHPECTAGRVPSKIEGIFQRQGTQSIENGFNPIWVGPCDRLSLGCNWASDLVAN